MPRGAAAPGGCGQAASRSRWRRRVAARGCGTPALLLRGNRCRSPPLCSAPAQPEPPPGVGGPVRPWPCRPQPAAHRFAVPSGPARRQSATLQPQRTERPEAVAESRLGGSAGPRPSLAELGRTRLCSSAARLLSPELGQSSTWPQSGTAELGFCSTALGLAR